MDSVFGFVGKDFVIVGCDSAVARSILKLKEDENKIVNLDDNKLLALSGEAGERLQFGDYVQKNIHLLKYKHGKKLSTKETANFMRTQMAAALRKSPFYCQTILAGFDPKDGPSLYWIDYMACMQKVKTAAQGYCGYFLGGLFDNAWKNDLSEDEANVLVQNIMKELGTRFLITQSKFVIKKIDANGVHDISSRFQSDMKA